MGIVWSAPSPPSSPESCSVSDAIKLRVQSLTETLGCIKDLTVCGIIAPASGDIKIFTSHSELPLVEERLGWLHEGIVVEELETLGLQKDYDYVLARPHPFPLSAAAGMPSVAGMPTAGGFTGPGEAEEFIAEAGGRRWEWTVLGSEMRVRLLDGGQREQTRR